MNWKDHINGISVKLNRANALLFKIRNFVNITILKTIYFVIFNSHINYPNLVWTQNSNAMSRIITLQKRLWELLFSNQGTVIQVLYFRNLSYLNSMINSFLKLCFWSVILQIVSCHQSSTIGSLFALIFITMKQLHLLLVNYLNFLSALTFMEKIQLQ